VRRHQRRQANRRHQQTLRGRLAHSHRQQAYRLRLARARYRLNEKRVTDHSSQAPLRVRPSRPVSSPTWVTIFLLLLSSAAGGLVTCQFCGRRGGFLNSS
jgi:hypothetical protein